MIVDSYWNERRQMGGRIKEGEQERTLNDGRTFKIYKKYFSQSDMEALLANHRLVCESLHVGEMFVAAIASTS